MSRLTPNVSLTVPDTADVPDVPYWLGKLSDRIDALLQSEDVTNACTAAAGWTVNTANLYVRRGQVHLYINVTRSGAAIAAAASGNISNVDVCQINRADLYPIQPMGGSTSTTGGMASLALWTNGFVSLAALPPNVGVATNDAFTASFVYPLPLPALA